MWLISQKFRVTLDALKAANPLVSPPNYVVTVGQFLNIPVGSQEQRSMKTVTNMEPLGHQNDLANGAANGVHTLKMKAPAQMDGWTKGKLSMKARNATQTYTVVAGDSMWLVAQKLHVPIAALEATNPQVAGPAFTLQLGQVLSVPGGSSSSPPPTYTVVAGDSMWLIAQKLHIPLTALEAVNPQAGSGTNFSLHPGQVLNLPAAGSSSTGPSGGGSSSGGDPGTQGNPTVHAYSGPPSSFPNPSQWQKFSLMSTREAATMNKTNNSPQETQYVLDAVATVSDETGIDKRGILAVIMQESHGQVNMSQHRIFRSIKDLLTPECT